MKKYLIFGTGFIATAYVRFLLEQGGEVAAVFHSAPSDDLPKEIQRKSSTHARTLERLIRKENPSYIILTQGLSFIPDNEKELRRSIESNVMAPIGILEAVYQLRKKGGLPHLEKILTFGSAAEYGERAKLWHENATDTHPTSLYGLVKHWLFEASRFYADLGLPTVHLRHFNTVGPGQNPRFVVASFARQIAAIERGAQKPFLTVGDLSQKRDFIDVRDAIAAYELILRAAPAGAIVNICSGRTYPIRKMVDLLRSLSKKKFKVAVDRGLFSDKRTRDKTLSGRPDWLIRHGWKPARAIRETLAWILDETRKEHGKK